METKLSPYANAPTKLSPSQEKLKKRLMRACRRIVNQREEILEAFIAKYGFQPDECQQIVQQKPDGTMRWFVEKLEKPPLVKPAKPHIIIP